MKKNNAFTLIELLGSIIIIAIISLIATPIILNYITDSKKATLERGYESIERGAEYYIKNEYGGTIEEEIIIPLKNLKEYLENMPTNYLNEYVVVRDLGNVLDYYYSGRESNPYDKDKTLKELIEDQTVYMKYNVVINGKTVNKVIGSKDDKNKMNNYVWYSGYLWQVIETNEDGIKMVMAYAVTDIAFGNNSDYKKSWVRKWLNDISNDTVNYTNADERKNSGLFYNNLSRKDLLVDTDVCVDQLQNIVEDPSIQMSSGVSSRLVSFTPISECEDVISDKVAIMTVEDYAYAYDGTLNEYAHNSTAIADETKRKKGGLMGYNFTDNDDLSWLATPSNVTTSAWVTQSYNPGFVSKTSSAVKSNGRSVRPVITIKNTVRIESGNGGINNPYLIKGITTLKKGAELSYGTPGEFLYIDESNNPYETNQNTKQKVLYRIVETSEDYIKIQRQELLSKLPTTIAVSSGRYTPFYTYYDENVNSNLWCYYDTATQTYYYQGCVNNNYFKESGTGNYELYKGNSIPYFLNNADNSFYSWIANKYQNIILEMSFDLPTSGSGRDATLSRLVNSKNKNSLTYPQSDYDGTYKGKVSLPLWGDILSGNDLNQGYWLNNRWTNSNTYTSFINSSGNGQGYYSAYQSVGIRPVLYLDENTKILSGSGTKLDPYQLKVE